MAKGITDTSAFSNPSSSSRTELFNPEKIRLQVAQSGFPGEKKVLVLTIRFGVACYTNEQSIDDCIKAADEALYRAKQQGRNRVVTNEAIPQFEIPFS